MHKNKWRNLLQPVVLMSFMLLSAYLGWALTPHERLSDHKVKIDLPVQVPITFGDWQEDKSVVPVLPDPELQAKLDSLYSATLSRTYVNTQGERIMLSIAYGNDQSSEATAVHRPEFCYSSQGFKIENKGVRHLTIGNHQLEVQNLLAYQGQRVEPITYWITVNDVPTLPGVGRKLKQLQYGLKGQIPDGMLIRISSIGADAEKNYLLQEAFLNQLAASMTPTIRQRYFGT